MKKVLLIVLLIFVQSKKLNTFQEFQFRDLDIKIVDDKTKEELRKNKVLKEIAFKYCDLFEKSNNQEEINLALKEDYPIVQPIIQKAFENNFIISAFIKGMTLKEAECLVTNDELKKQFSELIVAFYNYDDATLDSIGLDFLSKILQNLRC